jgi:hypothetical protein
MAKQKNNKRADGSYYDGKFETIEYIEYVVDKIVQNGIEPKRAYCVGQVLKYLSSRLGAKADTPVELDLQKAENYLHRALTGEWINPEFLKKITTQEQK